MSEKILIALGDRKLAGLLTQKMQEEGYVVEIAENTKDVLSKIKSFAPDLGLIGINLPVIEDYELFTPEYINKDIAKLPMILVSSSGDPIQMNKIPSTPMVKDYVINFHIDPGEVIQKVNKVFGKQPIVKNENQNVATNNKSILWVEDDKLLSGILSKKLEKKGYRLLRAMSGDEALKIIETEVPSMAILDIMMPGINGMDVLKAIKNKQSLQRTPVMILSNLSRDVDVEMAKNMGANRYLVKAAVSLDEIVHQAELEMNRF